MTEAQIAQIERAAHSERLPNVRLEEKALSMAEILNFGEAAQRAGVSRERLNKAIRSGRLPATGLNLAKPKISAK